MRAEDELTEIARNPLIFENPENRHCKPSQATDSARASHQSSPKPRMIHCLGLDHLWITPGAGVHASRGRAGRNSQESIDL